ncbi:MAG: type II toxin-antitoxin system Phd/YefM family antitoxin [Acidaminococcaceae bacterium]|nr:type II toxin-antitoxin system Phd/YefM family antitoxin [Acidaminococcaceae bacterium]MBQ9697512.1 type II toxin-antitoxin system Phd/YefM family antitoxin [Acidaminococcaceae bacterium]MBR1590727.1 type II toxin-antitoxin system Phd/YefM family antitoxin [Acidaminococcaceae bacterium]
MQVTATEFKLNFGKYLEMVVNEDIYITRNGKTVAKMINPNVSAVDSIAGILEGRVSPDTDRHSLREERLAKYESHD